ncbi:hypothetical protein D3C84_706700 [compost metagenome]
MQIVPIDLARIRLWDLCRLASEAEVTSLTDPHAGVFVCTWFVVQCPDQLWRLTAASSNQGFQRLLWIGIRGKRGNGGDTVLHQGDGIENALDDPQFVDLQQVHTGWYPPVTLVAFARLETRFLLAEAVRLVDEPLPIAAFFEWKANGGRANVQVPIKVMLLGVPAFNLANVEAAGEGQVGLGTRSRLIIGGRGALAPVVEQVAVQLFDRFHVAAFLLATAADEPWLVIPGKQPPLVALGAGSLAHVLGAGHVLQTKVGLEPLQYISAQLMVHGLHCARSTALAPSCFFNSLRVRQMPARCGMSLSTFGARWSLGTFR